MVDAGSIVAVEVAFYHAPGTNPETEAPHVVADLYVDARRRPLGGKGREGAAPHHGPRPPGLGRPGAPEAQPIENQDLPKWIEPEQLKDLDQRARAVVVQSLQPGRSAEMGLKELADHRRSEVARLARRCLGYLGNFDPAGRGA